MCLSFGYYQAQIEYRNEEVEVPHHDDVDCSNIQQYYLKLEDGSTAYLAYMPVKSESSVMVCYPVDHRALGENDQYIVPCSNILCQASALEGRFNPAKFVKPPPRRIPATRGIGGGIKTRMQEEAIVLPQGKCIEQMDGSVIFTLKTASLVRESKHMRRLGKLCASELMRMMHENNVDVSRIFATDISGSIKTEALDLFLEEFIPNLRPGCDVIVCIPPFSATGKPLLKQGGSFNFAFRYPSSYAGPLPLLGLVHNIPEGQTMSNLVDVEGHFYIVSNCFSSLMLGRQEREITFGINIPLSLELSSFHSVEVQQNKMWQGKCFLFQKKCEVTIMSEIKDVVSNVFGTNIEKNNNFYAQDLKGRRFFNDAVSALRA
jgi:hypothetical protein